MVCIQPWPWADWRPRTRGQHLGLRPGPWVSVEHLRCASHWLLLAKPFLVHVEPHGCGAWLWSHRPESWELGKAAPSSWLPQAPAVGGSEPSSRSGCSSKLSGARLKTGRPWSPGGKGVKTGVRSFGVQTQGLGTVRARALDTTPQRLGTLRPGLRTPLRLGCLLRPRHPGVSCAASLLLPGPAPHRCFSRRASRPPRARRLLQAESPSFCNKPPARPRTAPVGKHLCGLAGPHLQLG